MNFATIKNWAEFQHYKDRSPPWLKIHRGLLDDFEFQSLPIASKALAPMLWLIASEAEKGIFRVDADFLAFRLRWPVEQVVEGLKPLISKGFVVLASGSLAECLQDACLEGEGEGETEGEGEKNVASATLSPAGDDAPPCPHQEVLALYHELLPANPRIKVWDGARAEALRTRWREDPKRQSLDYWRRFFVHVSASEFLTGRREGRGERPFLPGLEWMVKKANFAKIIEGRYHE